MAHPWRGLLQACAWVSPLIMPPLRPLGPSLVTGSPSDRSGGAIVIMPHPLPVTVAWQGLVLHLPDGCEIAGTYGAWRDGQMLVARDRQPSLSISWKRETLRPELDRTLAAAVKRLRKELPQAQAVGDEAAGSDGLLRRFTAPGGDRAVAVRHYREAGVTLVWRQLAPGPGFGDAVRAAEAVASDAPAPWIIHGLDLTLPPWWRVEGVQALAGLTRGVWMRYPDGRVKPDQVLVVRRMACASRVLANRTPSAWLQSTLQRNETVISETRLDEAWRLHCRRPGATWWRRLRGRTEERYFDLWLDEPADRLTIQEWTGQGTPLPCLRQPAVPHGSPLPAGAPVA